MHCVYDGHEVTPDSLKYVLEYVLVAGKWGWPCDVIMTS